MAAPAFCRRASILPWVFAARAAAARALPSSVFSSAPRSSLPAARSRPSLGANRSANSPADVLKMRAVLRAAVSTSSNTESRLPVWWN